jgi:hypothetical protein
MHRPNLLGSTRNAPTTAYVAIRYSDDGHEWLDTSTVDYTITGARAKADKTDNYIRQWAQANRVVRIAQVELREVK